MKIVRMNLGDLKPASYNPRKPLKPGSVEYERLARSMREFDLVQPLIWNRRTGNLVGGHQRYQILRDQGVSEVEVVEVDLPIEREKGLNIALNNSRVGSDWDLEKLADVLEELRDLPEMDWEVTGFQEGDLRELRLEPMFESIDESIAREREKEIRMLIPRDQWNAESQRDLDAFIRKYQVRIHVGE